jgi:hypothetical protein
MKTSKVNQVENFEKLLVFCTAQSAVYQPSKESIQVAALNTLLTQARIAMKAADVSRTAYENAINARQPMFSTVHKLASRVIDALKASGVAPEVVEDAMAIKRRFNGPAKRLVTPAQNGSPDGNASQGETLYQRRISQLDLASKVENFERLVNRVTVEPLYQPNETDLQLPALTAFVSQLRITNRNVINAYMALKNASHVLNSILFGTDGIHGNAKAVKAYIRSVFGRGTVQHKQVSVLSFTKK